MLALTLFFAVTLHGRVSVPLESLTAGGKPCAVDGLQWSCSVEHGDVRLEPEGYAPVYLFDLEADRDAGLLPLHRGPSVSGFVSAAHAKVKLGDRIVEADGHGFYQFTEVAPGLYDLVATAPQRSAARIEGLRVAKAREYAQRKLTLPELATIDLLVQPPVDVDGRPWMVRLLREVPSSSTTTVLTRPFAEGAATPAGQWKKAGIEAGRYEVQIVGRAGEVVASERIEAAAPSQFVNIVVERVAVRGTVKAGGDPIRAKLLFESDGRRVEARTDEHGLYIITLPREGEWQVSVSPEKSSGMLRNRSLTVHRRSGEVFANGDLELPGGRLNGTVVDEDGKGVVANLLVRRRAGRMAVLAASREDGTFELVGLDPGDVVVTASSADADSAPISAHVPDDDAATIRVPLARTRKLPLTIVTSEGTPVAGAAVSYVVPAAGRLEAISSPSGRVELEVNGTMSALDVVVTVPGLPVKVASLPVVDGRFATPTLVMADAGGTLVVQLHGVWPMVAHAGSGWVGLPAFSTAGRMQESLTRRGFVALVEPGRYTFCPVDGSAPCIEAQVTAGQETLVDLGAFRGTGE